MQRSVELVDSVEVLLVEELLVVVDHEGNRAEVAVGGAVVRVAGAALTPVDGDLATEISQAQCS